MKIQKQTISILLLVIFLASVVLPQASFANMENPKIMGVDAKDGTSVVSAYKVLLEHVFPDTITSEEREALKVHLKDFPKEKTFDNEEDFKRYGGLGEWEEKYKLPILEGMPYKSSFWTYQDPRRTEINEKTAKYTYVWERVEPITVKYFYAGVDSASTQAKAKIEALLPKERVFPAGVAIPNPENITETVVDEDNKMLYTFQKWTITKNEVESKEFTSQWVAAPLSNKGSVTFVIKKEDGEGTEEQVIKFASLNETINHTDEDNKRVDEGDKGGGFAKAYFIAWSTVPNYDGTQKKAKVFYGHEPISRAFPFGLSGNEKLYAFYLDVPTVLGLSEKLSGKIYINKKYNLKDTLYDEFLVKADNKTYYLKNNLKEVNLVKLGANFELNPYITSVVRRSSYYHHPGNIDFGAPKEDDFILKPSPNLENLKENIKSLKQKYTYVDLHVKLDPRLTVAEQLKFSFKSYAFRPLIVLNKDYSGVLESEITTRDNNPVSSIVLTTSGEKEFILRTRIRTQWDIPDATAEEALQDMELISDSEKNFSLDQTLLKNIARGKEKPIEIGGHIQGGANLYQLGSFGGLTDIPRQEAEIRFLDFKPAIVTFNRNSSKFGDVQKQDLGQAGVATGAGIDNDILDGKTMPKEGETWLDAMPDEKPEAMPKNLDLLNIDSGVQKGYYTFLGWSTLPDATLPNFDGNTVVNEDMTVYAVWKKEEVTIVFDKNDGVVGKNIIQTTKIAKGTSLDKLPSNPIRDGYTFLGWSKNSKAKTADLPQPQISDTYDRDTNFYAIWKKNETPNTGGGGSVPSQHAKTTPEALNSVDHMHYIVGYPDETVRPNKNITRAELTSVYYRLLTDKKRDEIFTSMNTFRDVSPNSWYNKAVSSMTRGKYIAGYPDGTFGGNRSMTRAEFVAVTARFLDKKATSRGFIDVKENHWAKDAISTGVYYGWLSGYPDGTFKPDQAITRAEVMAIINRLLDRGVDENGLKQVNYKKWVDNEKGAWYYYDVIEATHDHTYTGKRPNEVWTSLKIDRVYDYDKYEKPENK